MQPKEIMRNVVINLLLDGFSEGVQCLLPGTKEPSSRAR